MWGAVDLSRDLTAALGVEDHAATTPPNKHQRRLLKHAQRQRFVPAFTPAIEAQRYARAVRRLASGLVFSLFVFGCKSAPPTTAPTADAPADEPIDQMTWSLLEKLAASDYEGLQALTVQPLTHDLSHAEFEDVAAIVAWLGPLQSHAIERSDASYGGGQRWYTLQFDKGGAVELEVSLDDSGKLIGFQFDGDGYLEAERGVLAEPWREFKVYDFALIDSGGAPLPKDGTVAGTRVDYELVVGGIEALLGEHHLSVEKVLRDASGKEIFREPIEYDTKFDEDSMGIPRGVVRGHVEVPGAGAWKLDLRVTDENAHRDIEYQASFKTQG